jgi:DNA-binding transcriptional ArsR family regulator
MADIFGVIADATRRDILRLLLDADGSENGGVSVTQMVQRLGVSQPTVSKHLKVLRDAGMVAVREDGQHRYYRLVAGSLDEIEDWLMPFAGFDGGGAVTLPAGAAAAAQAMGRTAASVSHAVTSGWKRRSGR